MDAFEEEGIGVSQGDMGCLFTAGFVPMDRLQLQSIIYLLMVLGFGTPA